MHLFNKITGSNHTVYIEPLTQAELRKIKKKDFFFNWNEEAKKGREILKLILAGSDEILGLVSIEHIPSDERIHIHLLSCRADNVGKAKQFERITGCLIAWVGRKAVGLYGAMACVSLIPKTKLRPHYMRAYGMSDAGMNLFLDDQELYQLINNYLSDED